LRGWFRDAGVELTTSRRRPPTPDGDVIAVRVSILRDVQGIHCGERHTAESIALPGQPPLYNAVYHIMHPMRAPVDRPVRAHDHKFVPKYVD
jgi:hypothetical protein